MEGDSSVVERQEFRNDFRLAVYQLMQFVENELGDGRHRIRPDDSEWRLQRAKTIEKLKELIEKLDKTCVAANYGKSVGIGASIVGDLTSLFAVLLELRESSSAQGLKNIGSLVSHSGSLLEGASNAAESLISAKYLAEIEQILQKDQELSIPLQEWLAFSRNMDDNVREMFGCDLNFAIQNNVLKVFSEFTKIYNRSRNFQQTIDLMSRGSYSMEIGTNVPLEILLRFSSQLEMHPELLGSIQVICSTLSNSATSIQVISEGVRVCRNLLGLENLNSRTFRNSVEGTDSVAPEDSDAPDNCKVEGGSRSLRTQKEYSREAPTGREVSTFCAFQTINTAVNVVHMSSAITSIKDGKSKYSNALQQISNLLAMELRSMEAL